MILCTKCSQTYRPNLIQTWLKVEMLSHVKIKFQMHVDTFFYNKVKTANIYFLNVKAKIAYSLI